jgi:hypothetical protein
MYKLLISLVAVIALSGCGTAGGLISGAGTDLQRAGDWIKSK